MNTTFHKQIAAIQLAIKLIGSHANTDNEIVTVNKISAALNDAASTIAALNLSNPYEQVKEQAARIAELKSTLKCALDAFDVQVGAVPSDPNHWFNKAKSALQ